MNSIYRVAKDLTQYVYHIQPPKFKGKFILPLSELETEYPEIYRSEFKKYKDREQHPETKIDLLDCSWKDCVNFSTLDITKIFQLEKLLGVPGYKEVDDIVVWKFPIEALKDMEFYYYDDNISPKKKEAYSKVSVRSYKETEFVPDKTVEYYLEAKNNKERPLLFGYLRHILVKGKVLIDLAEKITLGG